MKLVLLSLALSALASCSSPSPGVAAEVGGASSFQPADVNVQVSLMWSLKSASGMNDVTIGKGTADWNHHGACFFGDDTHYLLGVAPLMTKMTPSTDMKPYLDLAIGYVQTLKTSSGVNWAVDALHASPGHCWNSTNQVWEDCPPPNPTDPPKAYAFQLLKDSGSGPQPYFDYSKIANPAGTVNINYYVIVQLQ